MSLPKWVQEAVGKGQKSVCIELCRHATAVEIDACAVKRYEKKEEIELQSLVMERAMKD